MPAVGYWAIVVVAAVSAYTVVAAVWGARNRHPAFLESARNGVYVAGAAATVAAVLLVALLVTRDYSVKYVYEHVNSILPTPYALSALWAGQEGSLLLWLWLVALCSVILVLWKRMWREPFGPYVLAVMAFTQGFLSLILVLVSDPFEGMAAVPLDGQGMNPLLQNFWMVIHPPVVFVGYAAYTVPFALAVGGLVVGRLDTSWLRTVRRWALFAWLFLGTGILMGAWWAYLELGWGGYWGWDPVENSSLIPWLVGTATLHSLMMQQRRNAFKTWNLWLVTLTFVLCVFATFVTRSGIIQSVHAFGRSAIGTYFAAFIALCLVALAMLVSLRRRSLRDGVEYRGLLARETSLLATNLLLLGAALVVLVGTLFPALVELFQGRQAALDTSFYERTVGPLAQLIIALIGVCPWLPWGGISWERLYRELLLPAIAAVVTAVVLVATGTRQVVAIVAFAVCAFVGVSLLLTFYRGIADRRQRTAAEEPVLLAFLRLLAQQRRRYGAHLVHLGIVLIAMGVTGSSVYQQEVQIALTPGEEIEVEGYTLAYGRFVPEELPGYQRFTAVVDVQRGDRYVTELRPKKDFHWNVEQWVTEVAIHANLKEDLYLILAGFEEDGLASFRVLINPLVTWLWIGGAMLLVGGTMAWWPTSQEWSRS